MNKAPSPHIQLKEISHARVKRGVTAHAKHKKILKAAKGYYGRRKNTIRIAKQAVEKANQYAYATASAASARSALVDPAHQCTVRPLGSTTANYRRPARSASWVDRKVLPTLPS